jgi:hypothetical protein
MNAVKFGRNSVGGLSLKDAFVRRDRVKDQSTRKINEGIAEKRPFHTSDVFFNMDR